MPISAENRKRYPPDWRSIRAAILKRAHSMCECEGECGIDHKAESEAVMLPDPSHRCYERNGRKHSVTEARVVLTVAHLNHTPEDCRPENLRAMCQRCHNRYDVKHRQATAATTRHRKRGDLDLMGGPDA